MPFCSSCGTGNPDNAKFCAKCGSSLAAPAAPQPAAPAAPRPAAPKPAAPPAPQPVRNAEPPTAPPAPRPAPTPAKQALSSPPVKAQVGSKKEPIPGAPNQTQFFMAAAGVSTGAKFKKLIIFIVVALIVGTGLFFLVRFAMHQQEQKVQATKLEKKTHTSPAPGPAAAPEAVPAEPAATAAAGEAAAVDKDAKAGNEEAKKAAADSTAKNKPVQQKNK